MEETPNKIREQKSKISNKKKIIFLIVLCLIGYEVAMFIWAPRIVVKTMYTASASLPQLKNTELIEIDGMKIHYKHFKRSAGKCLLSIVWLHGSDRNIVTDDLSSKDNGFVQIFDEFFFLEYPGFSGAPGELKQEIIIKTILSFLKSLSGSCPEGVSRKVIIGGWSLGGAISLLVAASGDAYIDGVLSVSPFTSAKDAAFHLAGFIKYTFYLRDCGYNALASVSKIKVPCVIIGSENDENCPFFMQEKVFKKLQEKKTIKSKLIKIPGKNHYAIYEDSLCDYKLSDSEYCNEMRGLKDYFE